MFFGEFEYKIDEKGRLPIPPKFRPDLRDGIMLAPGLEKCLIAYPMAEWTRLSETLTSGSISPGKLRRLYRAIFSSAFNLTLDGQGRIALPIALREYAGIKDEVVVAGANKYLELWNKESWESEKTASLEQAWQIMESLERH